MDYGPEPVCLVAVQDIPPETHTTLAGEPDCVAVPSDLDSEVGAQLTQVRNVIEALNIPAGWVQSTHTYRQLLRIVAAMFQFMQRFAAVGGNTRVFQSGINLDSTYGSLPLNVRNALRDTADSLGYDRSGIVAGTTVRAMLKQMGDQWSQLEIHLGGETF
jgi:hypothetical protein